MKRLMRIKAVLLLLIGSVALNSCIMDEREVYPEQKSESVTFKINVPANGKPASRALSEADEYAVGDVAVLGFDKTTKKFKGRYSGRIVSGPTHTGGASASMTFEVSLPKGDLDLMIVANAGAMLNACTDLTVGTAQATIEEALKMSMTTSGWNSTTGSATLMPMWGYVKNVNVPDNFPLSTIYLTRMVAKVDVQLGGSLVDADGPTGDFFLQEVYVYNYVEQGRLIPYTSGSFEWAGVTQSTLADNETPSLPSGYTKADSDTEWLSYNVANPYQSLKNEIYLFEAPLGVKAESGSDAYWNNTCLVVGGSYDGHTTSYYRIDFARRTDVGAVTTYTFLPILRNNSYTVTITGVSGDGHGRPEDALHSAPTNITANILDWNNENITTIVTDGVYMLGVSQGSFEFSSDARTAGDTDNRLTIVTNHSGGWSATVWADETGETALPNGSSGQPWLRLSAASGNGSYPNGNDIQLIADPNDSADRTAYIHIKAGTLNYIIKVVQRYLYLKITDVITGQELTSVSFNSKNSLLGTAPTPRQVKVEWSPMSASVTVGTTPGTNELEWNSSYNTTLTGGAYVFTIDPDALTAAEVAAPNEFLSKTTRMTFTLGATAVTANLDVDQTHYQLIPTGLGSVDSGTATQTATIRSNANWTSTTVQSPTILSSNGIPASAVANETGANYNITFNGTAGQATFTFKSATAGLFDDVVVTIKSGIIAPRFAKSNIVLYIDGDDNRILTFAETEADFTSKTVAYTDKTDGVTQKNVIFTGPTALTANVQGIHFRWGGLVGLSSNANASSSTAFKGAEDIKFWPAEYEATCAANNGGLAPDAVTWKYNNTAAQWQDATQVPYLGDQTITTTTNTYDAFEDYFDADYFSAKGESTTVGYDAKAGYGDICRYMSEKGWVVGNWRMPTRRELELLYSETTAVGQIDNGLGNMQYGVMYGTYSSGTNWNYLAMTNPDATYTDYYGFTPVANARMIGGGITAADRENPDYLTKGGEARVVLPGAGYRNGSFGHQYNPGNYGYYWGSTPGSATNGSSLNVTGSGAGTTTGGSRSNGFSVRCIRQNN